jgi:hypothetical protein
MLKKHIAAYISFSLIWLAQLPAADHNADIKIISQNETELIFEWQPQNLTVTPFTFDQSSYDRIHFENAVYPQKNGMPQLPHRIVVIGIPENSAPKIKVLSQQTQNKPNIQLLPVPRPVKNKRGLSYHIYEKNDSLYRADASETFRVIDISKFRDINIMKIALYPAVFLSSSQTLILRKKMTFKIQFGAKGYTSNLFKRTGAADDLYEDILINYEQAKNWQQFPAKKLKKTRATMAGNWLRTTVTKDGLYKITAAALQSQNAELSSLEIDQLQMFNNGGHILSYNTTAEWYNPPYTKEIPLFVVDNDGNGLLDGSDYFLFYGKALDGWYYQTNTQSFSYLKHPFAVENYYWLKTDGANGLRMTKEIAPELNGTLDLAFYQEKFRFEEDLYNLLASGPDWYGKRFYGLSDAYSKNFEIEYDPISGMDPVLKIQLKGGSGISYGDHSNYNYYFDFTLNNKILYKNIHFGNSANQLYNINLSEPNLLKSGSNQLMIQYRATKYESSAAYLDYFELQYTKNLTAVQNHLNFYTSKSTQKHRYRINNISGNDVYIFDVTDPANPVIIKENLTARNNEITVDVDVASAERRYLLSSLSSPTVHTVSSFTSVTNSGFDLLDANNEAEYLIITHKSFSGWAKKVAELHDHLSYKVVNTEDIYFQFNAGVQDPTAIRNFIKYARENWANHSLSYVLLFGDGHYDYRNISLRDSMRVPPFEIYGANDLISRASDVYFADINYKGDASFKSIIPDLAIGRIPIESNLDAERYYHKLQRYINDPILDGWQTNMTLVADDQHSGSNIGRENMHQLQTEEVAKLSNLNKFIKRKIYLSEYESKPGGFGRVMPAANNDIIKSLNSGTLIINFTGHGSPREWAHENVFNFSRDLNRIRNAGKLPFLIAATCDFGKFDDPHVPSFTEGLIWQAENGAIGVLAATRIVYSDANSEFNKRFLSALFPIGQESRPLGDAFLQAFVQSSSNINDHKYLLFANPVQHLADPKGNAEITSISADTLKALSNIQIEAQIMENNIPAANFNGGAILLVNDARYDSIFTAEPLPLISKVGPGIFKGEVSVVDGKMTANFMVPKSIRYHNKRSGRASFFAWNADYTKTAIGYKEDLLFLGSIAKNDNAGPEIDIYFEGQENFTNGDIVSDTPTLIADIHDESGINITGETGHLISLQIDDEKPIDISSFFAYNRDSFTEGKIRYPLDQQSKGERRLKLTVFDNLNNPSEISASFRMESAEALILADVVNYPNPFRSSTRFTFQTNRDGAEVKIKIYTITGRLIQELYGISNEGYNESITWDGRDRDGDKIANGVYLYKIIIDDGKDNAKTIDKLMILE